MDLNLPSVSHQLGVPQPALSIRVLRPDEQLYCSRQNFYSNDKVLLLLHAVSCKKSESQTTNGESLNCTFPNCQEMKNLLTHQQTCTDRNECPVPDCNSTRNMILKLRGCQCVKCKQDHELLIASIDHPERMVQRRLPTTSIDSLRAGQQPPAPVQLANNNTERKTRRITHKKLFKKHLSLLINARACLWLRRNSIHGISCSLPPCTKFKNALIHMKTCNDDKQCLVPLCGPSRIIISHFKKCPGKFCPLCLPLRPQYKKIAANIALTTANYYDNKCHINNHNNIMNYYYFLDY